MKYFWVRIFDYNVVRDSDKTWPEDKGTLLDEYYLQGDELSRDEAKKSVKERSGVDKFAKPRKKNGVYAIVMDSTEHWYNRFMVDVDCGCFECGKHIKGKMKDFPKMEYENENFYFCSYDCYRKTSMKIHSPEGEFQEREGESQTGVFGYIYHIYNRSEDMHYVGQTIYMPFFRWQEHAKSGLKGDITDLIFETVTEVRVKSQEYLNNIEAWWINKFIHDYGREKVKNISVPKLSMGELVKRYRRMVEGQIDLEDYAGSNN